MSLLKRIVLTTLFLCAAALPAKAQRILPSSFSGWTCASLSGLNLAQPNGPVSGDASAIAHEYGFDSGEQCTYTGPRGTLQVQLYQMKDASAAYGEYSYLRTPDLPRASLTEHSSLSPARALILEKNFVVDVIGQDLAKSANDLKALTAALQPRALEGQLPVLWQHLPADNEISRSDHYVLGPAALGQFFPLASGDWLGFSEGAEAETAHYQLGADNATLLLADFPTPQLAADKLNELQTKLGVNDATHAPGVFAKRIGTLLAIVSGAKDQTDATVLLEKVQVDTEITWNEPAFQFKEPSIEMMIVGAIVGTGSICGFALIAGLAFGGFRLFIKRLLPGKVFDRSSQLQVLQLGLASKPINSEDFYGIQGRLLPADTVDKDIPDRVALRIFR